MQTRDLGVASARPSPNACAEFAIRVAFYRRELIEQALRIVMAYAGLAEWRRCDRRRLEVTEYRHVNTAALDHVSIGIALDGARVWRCDVVLFQRAATGRVAVESYRRWEGRLAALETT